MEEDEALQALLHDLAGVVPQEPPEPRGALADILAGKRVLPRQRRARRTVAGGTALAVGMVLGTGMAAAASNHLPDPAQRAAHDFSRTFLPFTLPAPVVVRHATPATEPSPDHPSTLPRPAAPRAVRHEDRTADRHGAGTTGRHHAEAESASADDSGAGTEPAERPETHETSTTSQTRRTSGGSDDGGTSGRDSGSEGASGGGSDGGGTSGGDDHSGSSTGGSDGSGGGGSSSGSGSGDSGSGSVDGG